MQQQPQFQQQPQQQQPQVIYLLFYFIKILFDPNEGEERREEESWLNECRLIHMKPVLSLFFFFLLNNFNNKIQSFSTKKKKLKYIPTTIIIIIIILMCMPSYHIKQEIKIPKRKKCALC